MSEHDRNGGIDRRAALKKGVAAGAIAWSAPAILSQAAGAQAPGLCTPKCLPAGSGQGTALASATCAGRGVRRVITVDVDLSAVQTFTCPCGGDATVISSSCSSNAGTCTVGPGGSITVEAAGRLFTGVFSLRVTLTQTASCPDRSPEDGNCTATCTTLVQVDVPVPDRGNCNGFPNTGLVANVVTSCA